MKKKKVRFLIVTFILFGVCYLFGIYEIGYFKLLFPELHINLLIGISLLSAWGLFAIFMKIFGIPLV